MKVAVALFAIAFLLMLIAGCSPSRSSGKNTAQNAPPPISHTVFAPYIRDMNKAKQVQNTVMAQKQAMDKEIQAQTAGTSTPAPSAQTPQ